MSRFLKTPDDPVVMYNLSAADFNTITANGFGEIDNDGGEILNTPIGTIPQNGSGGQGASNWLLINNNVYGINWQIACQGQGGTTNDMYFRSGTAGAWNAWKKLLANDSFARLTGQNANVNVLTYNVPGTTAAMFQVALFLNITAYTSGSISFYVNYTDAHGNIQSDRFNSANYGAGEPANSTGPAALSPLVIEALGGTTIQVVVNLGVVGHEAVCTFDATASLTFIS